MNKLNLILDKTSEIREAMGSDAFNDVPTLEYEEVQQILSEIEEIVLETRDDGEFEFTPIEEEND